jgi:hypothetical protein
MWIWPIQSVELLQMQEESTPCPCKLFIYFTPESFYSSVSCFAVGNVYKHAVLIWSTDTYDPHIYNPRFGPRRMIIQTAVSMFSPPRSPRTHDGVPYSEMARRNNSKTVAARLLVIAHSPVTFGVTYDFQQVSNTVWAYHTTETIYEPMNHKAPQDQLVMTIHVP